MTKSAQGEGGKKISRAARAIHLNYANLTILRHASEKKQLTQNYYPLTNKHFHSEEVCENNKKGNFFGRKYLKFRGEECNYSRENIYNREGK